MRVLVITNMYPNESYPSFGCFVKAQIDSLKDQGIDIEVLFINGERTKLNYLKGIWDTFRKIIMDKYDLIHAHHGFCGLIARLQFKYPVVISFGGSDIMGPFWGRASKFISRCVDASIVKSEALRESLGNTKAQVVPNGVNLKLFRPIEKSQARQRLSLDLKKKYILFLGDPKMDLVKRYDIVKSTHEILKRKYNFSGELLVIYRKPQNEVPLYMNACDVLVFSSNWGGSPNVIKEAMACNLPIVSVDVGDVKKLIGNTENCYICQRNPEDIATKLIRVLDENKRTNGREKILPLSSENIAKQIISLYRQVLNHKGILR